jgi:hypothetical protein
MPKKLGTKLKENEFYCVKARKRCTVKPENICVTTWKNGVNALLGESEKYDCKVTKIVKESKVPQLVKKYGECKRSRRRKSPVRKSKSRRKVSKSKRKSPKASKSRRKSRKMPCPEGKVRNRSTGRCRNKSVRRKSRKASKSRPNCKYGVKKSGGCKKKPGPKRSRR